MDPDETLRLIRRIGADLRNDKFDSNDEEHNAFSLLLEYIEDLDEWLTKGGYPPQAWRPVH